MIVVEDLSFAYRSGQAPIIEGLDGHFDAGTSTAVIGRSGTGKSTLLYLLGLMLSPTGGRITFDGVPVPRSDRARSLIRASRVGFVFQEPVLDSARSVLENVLEAALYAQIPAERSREHAVGLLERLGVDLRSDALPGEVSGGQAQRVALCRALLKEPDLLLADEPTGNLDQETSEVVWTELDRHAKSGHVVVVATHSMELAQRCDHLVTL